LSFKLHSASRLVSAVESSVAEPSSQTLLWPTVNGRVAELGIERLRGEMDTLIVIRSDRLLSLSDRRLSALSLV
jgi:hypothetical protein